MKRTLPLIITAASGFVLIIAFFQPGIQAWGEFAAISFDILAAIAFILGGGNLLKLQLKAVSDQKPGWGYSLVTIVAFVVTLLLGLSKLGTPPAQKAEYYGQTFAHLPLTEMPVYQISGEIPVRADGAETPASVRDQLYETNGSIAFRGWMSEDQKADLEKYRPTLDWRDKVEQLFAMAQPTGLEGKIHYYQEHESLAVDGVLTDDLRKTLEEQLGDSPTVQFAISELVKKSQRTTTVSANPPDGFQIPANQSDRLSFGDGQLTITGPMSETFRKQLSRDWAGYSPALPLSEMEQTALKTEIERLGNPLTTPEIIPKGGTAQTEVFDRFFLNDLGADAMILAINTAGVSAPKRKSAQELIAEREAGVQDLDPLRPAPDPVFLNEQQAQVIRQFFDEQSKSVDDLKSQLAASGTLSEGQSAAVDQFMASLPREAERLQKLGIALMRAGPLTVEQQQFLFGPAAEMTRWEATVMQLFEAAHQVKFAWSGEYDAEGSPFWWLYEYIFQPLLTTTFAMLAFYVASAAFRAFRAKNVEASLLLGTAFIVLLGRTFAGVYLTAWIPDALSALRIDQMTVYIMKIFNTAGNRAIMIGIALGIASTSLKVLLGIDRSYLGSGDD